VCDNGFIRMSGATDQFPDGIIREFTQTALGPDPDLAGPAFLISRLGYANLDPTPYLARLQKMGATVADRLTADDLSADPRGPIETLNQYLFEDQGFAGNTANYDDPRNSFLNQVLDRRVGIPITLALVYIEVARRAGVRVEGVNFPGHFLLRFPFGPDDDHESAVFIDPFHRGAVLSITDCRTLLRHHAGEAITFEPSLLAPATKQQILIRILINLKWIYIRMRSFQQGRALTELLLAINPSALGELRDRGLLAYHLNDFTAALRDLEAYLKFVSHADANNPEDREERTNIWEHVKTLRRRMARLN
jgi:regulator of sirC expression with transglutaminase-like and TPR domain